jgi:DtxR family Mn-dependent transcriptional regulator
MPRRKKDAGRTKVGEAAAPAERLTPVTENYLMCLYKLWEDSLIPTLTQLTDTIRRLPASEGLGTSVPSVAGMIRRMRRQALVDVGPDKRIRLTKKGFEGAENIARRHRLAEWLVVRLLGMDLHKAHSEAHRLEHVMSSEFEEKLAERLGYPRRCPLGRPIPGSGEPKMPVNALTLDSASLDVAYVVQRVPEEDPQLLHFLVRSLIIPDHEITVVEAAQYLGVLMVVTQGERVSIGYNVARQILVSLPEAA